MMRTGTPLTLKTGLGTYRAYKVLIEHFSSQLGTRSTTYYSHIHTHVFIQGFILDL